MIRETHALPGRQQIEDRGGRLTALVVGGGIGGGVDVLRSLRVPVARVVILEPTLSRLTHEWHGAAAGAARP